MASTTPDGNEYSEHEQVEDSVIREFVGQGAAQHIWRSWRDRDTLNLHDCQKGVSFPVRYAFLNSVQLVDNGFLASSRGCSQVLWIERTGYFSTIKWKLGGTALDPEKSDAKHLKIVNDDSGEFCGQHTATLTERDTILLFDNGVYCIGPRKQLPRFTRVVEYDISSGTEARLVNEYRPPPQYGVSNYYGSVQELAGGTRWLISWGHRTNSQVVTSEQIAVSEVVPQDGRVLLHVHMSINGRAGYDVSRSPLARGTNSIEFAVDDHRRSASR